jgi:general secretion pathway protein G
MHSHSTRRGAFTLVELMVVVLIIGILASIVTVSVTDYLSIGKQSAAKANIAELANALELFYMEFDRYPTSEEGLAELKKPTASHPNGILRSGSLLDAWGHPYVYVYPGLHGPYDIISYGANGVEGGTGADADIASWDLAKQNQATPK